MLTGFARRTCLVVGLFALACLGSFITFGEPTWHPQSTVPPTSASSTSQTDAHVLITISDKNGAPVSTPLTSDLLVLDNRQHIEIKDIQSLKNEPLIFSLLVDASASMKSSSALQIAGAIKLFAALSGQNNHGYLILFRNGVVTSDQFIDRESAEALLTRAAERADSTGLYDAINHAVTKQLALPEHSTHPRRAIFVMSDGSDNASHITLADTLNLVQREGIPVFCISVPTEARASEKTRGLHTLRDLSRQTGGDLTTLDGSGAFISRLMNSIDCQFVLNFSTAPAGRNEIHSLEVKSLSKDIKVAAPAHFLAP
jgi:VWFA-related protein